MEFLLRSPEQPADSSELLRHLPKETSEYVLAYRTESCYNNAECLAMLVQMYLHLYDVHYGQPNQPKELEYYTDPEALLRDHYHGALCNFYSRIHNSYLDRLGMVCSIDRFTVGGRTQVMLPDLCRQLIEQPSDPPLVVVFSHDINIVSQGDMQELLAYAHERRGYAVRALEKAQEIAATAGVSEQSRYAMHCEQLGAFLELFDGLHQAFVNLESFYQRRRQPAPGPSY